MICWGTAWIMDFWVKKVPTSWLCVLYLPLDRLYKYDSSKLLVMDDLFARTRGGGALLMLLYVCHYLDRLFIMWDHIPLIKSTCLYAELGSQQINFFPTYTADGARRFRVWTPTKQVRIRSLLHLVTQNLNHAKLNHSKPRNLLVMYWLVTYVPREFEIR